MDIDKEIDNLLWSIDEEAPIAASKQIKALIIKVVDEIIEVDSDTNTGLPFLDEPAIYQNLLRKHMRIKRDELLK